MDITPEQSKLIQRILKNNLPPDSTVWIFGSRTKKAKKEFSDLDLAIESKETLTMSIMVLLQEAFSESDLPYKVDIVDLNNVHDNFREKIFSERVLFLELKKS